NVNGVTSSVELDKIVAQVTTNDLSNPLNTITSTVNGIVKTAPAVNSNVVTLSGSTLTSSINEVEGIIDLAPAIKDAETVTEITPLVTAGNKIASYKNETANAAVDVYETITKLEVNPLAKGTLDYTDEKTITHKLDIAPLVKEPWFSTDTNAGATKNDESIYTMGDWVGIGYNTPSSTPNERLRVNGVITTVNSYFADYVFEDYFQGFSDIKADYKFKTLAEVDAFIQKNKHLPGITPITELEKTAGGYAFNISELSIQLLEKTEELYLHVIEQNKQLDAKNNEIEELKTNSKAINERLEKLEKFISEIK
ncbi:hypothetical protein ACFFUQ_20190, partial [Flavobacterium branchiarum]